MRLEQGLLPSDVDIEVGVGLVQVVDGDVGQTSDRIDQTSIHPGSADRGVGELDENTSCGVQWLLERGNSNEGAEIPQPLRSHRLSDQPGHRRQ